MEEDLTTREREVAELVAAGRRNTEIAKALCIELSTVETHVHHILAKLGARSRIDVAIRFGARGEERRGEERRGEERRQSNTREINKRSMVSWMTRRWG